MMLRNYAAMTNLEYHEKQLNYNSTSLLASIAEKFPDEQDRDLNDPKFAEFLAGNPYNPKIMGDLAHSLGLDKSFLVQIFGKTFLTAGAQSPNRPPCSARHRTPQRERWCSSGKHPPRSILMEVTAI